MIRLKSLLEAQPAGRAQKAIMKSIGQNAGSKIELSDLARGADFRGIHFGQIMSAASALKKKGLIGYDGKSQVWPISEGIVVGSGPDRWLDFTSALKDVDEEMKELKDKKTKLEELKKWTEKFAKRVDQAMRLSNRQMKNPKWQEFDRQINKDIEYLKKTLKELGYEIQYMDWSLFSGVK